MSFMAVFATLEFSLGKARGKGQLNKQKTFIYNGPVWPSMKSWGIIMFSTQVTGR